MIEFALILPIMLMLMISLLELGMAFRDFLTVSYTAREAARVGSLAGNDPEADCNIVQSVVTAFGPSDLEGVEIQIFKASENTGNPETGKVNTWTLNPGQNPADCSPPNWSVFEQWPSVDRQVNVSDTLELDILGVTIVTEHDWITGLPPWRGTMDLTRTALQRLEPEAFE